jgi:hypothetical protein
LVPGITSVKPPGYAGTQFDPEVNALSAVQAALIAELVA